MKNQTDQTTWREVRGARLPIVILADTGEAMKGEPVAELNRGLADFGRMLQEDPRAWDRTDICILSFDSTVQTVMEFGTAADYQPPVLTAGGSSPQSLDEAVEAALDALGSMKKIYREQGLNYYCPWILLVTNGKAGGGTKSRVKDRLREEILQRRVRFMPLGAGEDADMAKLRNYYLGDVQSSIPEKFSFDMFIEAAAWSGGIMAMSEDRPAEPDPDKVQLPPLPKKIIII